VEARTKPFIEVTQKGMMMYSSEKEFIRLDDEGFQFKGGTTTLSQAEVSNQLNVTGSVTILGEK
jgi:hypothetical protein